MKINDNMELLVKPRNNEEFLLVQSVLTRMRIRTELIESKEKSRRKREFLKSLERSVEQVNQHLRGEIELNTLDDFLDELRNNPN
jgi:hypothetical protein